MGMNIPEQHENSKEASAELDLLLTRALEAVPEVRIADDFALRVLKQAPAQRWPTDRVRQSSANVGRRVALATLAALLCLMLALVPATRGTSHLTAISVEWLLCLEFVAITMWMSAGPQKQP